MVDSYVPPQDAGTYDPNSDPSNLSIWLSRHLQGLARSGQTGQVSLAYDQAHLPDSVNNTLSQSGVGAPFDRPSALGDIFRSVGDNSGHLVPIDDMRAYQQRLSDLGYMTPGYQPSGYYDPETQQAHHAFGNSVASNLAGGEGKGGGFSPRKGLDLLFAASMPSHISKGIWGAIENLGHSALGTLGDIGDIFKGDFHPIMHNIGRDLLNIATVASMFVGVGEVFQAGRAGLGALGILEDAGQAAARWGVKQGMGAAGLSELPSVEAMKAMPSLSTMVGKWAAEKVGGEVMRDRFAETMATYGLKRFAEAPGARLLGGVLGGAAKASFIPQAAAIFAPSSSLGKAVNAAPGLPLWADIPAFVIHPDGIIPGPKSYARLFGADGFGHYDWARGYVSEPLPNNIRLSIEAQAYQKNLAMKSLGMDNADLEQLGPGTVQERFGQALQKVASRALVDPANEARGVTPEFQQAARKWANSPEGWAFTRAHMFDIVAGQQFREAQGLIGSNPVEDYMESVKAANRLTVELGAKVPEYQSAKEVFDDANRVLQDAKKHGTPQSVVRASQEVLAAKQRLASVASAEGLVKAGDTLDASSSDLLGRIGDKRILVMRADNPAESSNLQRLIGDWKAFRADDPTVDEQKLRGELAQLRITPTRVSDEDVLKELQAYQRSAAVDITDQLSPEQQQEFASRGYKAVLGGHNVILPTDVDPETVDAVHYSRLARLASGVGLSPVPIDQKGLAALAGTTMSNNLDFLLHSEGLPFGTGRAVVEAINDQALGQKETLLKQLEDAKNYRGRLLARLQLNNLTLLNRDVGGIAKAMQNIGFDEDEAARLAPMVKHTILQSSQAPGLLMSQHEVFGAAHRIATALQVHGWQGLVESLRALSLPDVGIGKVTLGDVPGLGAIARKYAFLPEKLLRGALTLRFTLNPLYEARLAVKQPLLQSTAEEISPHLFPARAIQKIGEDKVYSVVARATGEDPRMLSNAEHMALDSGIYGVNLTNHRNLAMYQVYGREVAKGLADGLSETEADARAIDYLQRDPKHVFGQGPRAPLEKSINFMFFPFSFEKKLIGNTAEYLTSEPIRIWMAHHAMQTLNQLNSIDKDHLSRFQEAVKRYAPVFSDIDKLNAFSHGVSVGQFAGLYGPLARSLALPVSAVRGALAPAGLNITSQQQYGKLLSEVAPGYKAVHNAVLDALSQAKVIITRKPTDAGQLDDYYAASRSLEEHYSQLGQAFGAMPTLAGFEQSSKVPLPFKQEYLQEKAALEKQYPAAAMHAAKYASTPDQHDAAVFQILSKVNPSRLEQGVVALEELRNQLGMFSTANGATPFIRFQHQLMESQAMQEEGVRLFKLLGPAFNDLWTSLGYEHQYGPIAEKVA